MPDVLLAPGEQAVHADHIVAGFDHAIAEMGTNKSRAAGDKDSLA